MIRKLSGESKSERTAVIAELERMTTLWSNTEFQTQFVIPLMTEIAEIEACQWSTSSEELGRLTRNLGLTGRTESDLLSLFMQARAVVAFVRKRLRPFQEAERKLNELRQMDSRER